MSLMSTVLPVRHALSALQWDYNTWLCTYQGGTAVFNESKIFTLPTNSSTLLNVRVWDSNTFSNENLGEAQIDVTTVSSSSVEIETFKKGKPSGKVTLELEMKPLSASEEAFAALDRDNSGGVR